jgi:acyl-CoA synthetase (AMP-forming)/AMP-acid ligase II
MLFVRGASVMQGYTEGGVGAGAQLLGGAYRDDNWLLTGDLFSADADGFLYFRGRAKELIKQGGFCLYPRDIEALVERHPGVLECVVVGVTTANADEMACLFVHGREALTREGLLEWLGRQLDPHYLPRRIDIVDAWPMNQNGKIDRKALGRRIEAELAGTEG